MPRPLLEVADILREHGATWRSANAGHVSLAQLKVMSAIQACRTAALGGHVEQCQDCRHTQIAYNSCRNRHCPKCQGNTARDWLEARQAELLPVPYYHVVFTVPAEIADIACHNKSVVYDLLFKASAETVLTIAAEPTGGNIFLGNEELTRLSGSRLRAARRRIGMIFQEYALVERLSVMENVLSGRLGYVSFWRSFTRRFPQADVDKAFSLLERVGLTDHADKRADALSGGQRQRVGIARALEQDPELLLIDEPTASLDPKTSRQIMRLIQDICAERNLPAIINIHDVLLAQAFTRRIIGLQAGEVVFDGPPEKLDDAALTRIYGEEDWTTMRTAKPGDEDSGEREEEERMAGLV